jgi:glycosyltransferase involved in cell wall biosynthesis
VASPIQQRVSVVCPFFNEQNIIGAAAQRMIANLAEQFADWELILVDDGSDDRSLEILLSVLDPNEQRVRVISCGVNQGRGRALKNGIDIASGEIIVTTEVDCSWGDDIAVRLAQEIQDNRLDMVVASPHMRGGGLVNVPFRRVVITRVGNFLINHLFSSGVSMSTGMTRGYRRDVIQPLVVTENGKEFHLEVLLKLRTLGFRIGEIPAVLEWQDEKLSANGSRGRRRSSTRLLRTAATHLRFVAVAEPRSHFGWFAALTAIGGVGFIGLAFFNVAVGAPSIFLAILGLQLFLFSLIFGGFAILFVESRDILREQWMKYYSCHLPPSAILAEEIRRATPGFADQASPGA